MKDQLIDIIHRNAFWRIVVGFAILYPVLTVVVFGYNQVSELVERNIRASIVAAPSSDYFTYLDVRTTKNTFKVGEPITFRSKRTYNGDYNISFIDRIICPETPRAIVEVATANGFTINTYGVPETVDWTFGDFTKGTPFVVKPINEPKHDCISEHLIAVEIAPNTYKTQLFINKNKFNVEE